MEDAAGLDAVNSLLQRGLRASGGRQMGDAHARGSQASLCLHQLFEARADAQPETICVIDAGSGGRWTYAEVRISSPRQPALRALLASDGFHSASKKNGLFSPALSLRDNWGDIHLKASHASRPASAGAEPPALRRRARAPRQYRLPLAPQTHRKMTLTGSLHRTNR